MPELKSPLPGDTGRPVWSAIELDGEGPVLNLDALSWVELMGISEQQVHNYCSHILVASDLRYQLVQGSQFQNILLQVIKSLDEHGHSVSGPKRQGDWERGWRENLEDYIASGCDLAKLTPRYLHKARIRRLLGGYIRPLSQDFEVHFYTVYRHLLFRKYLSEYKHIYEFGCGTGHNLVLLNQLFPQAELVGLDWAQSSIELVNAIGQHQACKKITGCHFDYFNPNYRFSLSENAAFITLNSLEQVGGQYQPFLEYVLSKKPALCINSEPIIEMYDDNILLDYLAKKYHLQRNYLNGYYGAIQDLERRGRIEIVEARRVHSGDLFHDGYSLVIWRPR